MRVKSAWLHPLDMGHVGQPQLHVAAVRENLSREAERRSDKLRGAVTRRGLPAHANRRIDDRYADSVQDSDKMCCEC